MKISIDSQNQEWIKSKIESGEFSSADELLAKARELLDEYHEDLQSRVQEGLEQLERGDSTRYTDETLHQFFDDIDRRGRGWLNSHKPSPS
jgi:Arc/MetJ-type ribon-helix-helix transcriptional regulator